MVRLLLTTLLAATSLFAQSHPSWWTLTDPGATALVGLQWENLSQTPFAGPVQAELTGSLNFPDLPILTASHQILISSPSLLGIATGNFPAGLVRTQAAADSMKPAVYRGIDLWISPGKTLSLARLNDQLVLIGLRKTLEEAIDRSQSETVRRYSPLLAPAARLAQGKDLWVIATQLPDPLAGIFVPIDAESANFEGGISFRDGMELHATLDAATDDAATAIAESLRQSIPTLPEIAKALTVSIDAHTVTMNLEVTPDQLSAALHPAPVTVAIPAPLPMAAPKPEGPQVIRIYGLDDGPREIILKPKNP